MRDPMRIAGRVARRRLALTARSLVVDPAVLRPEVDRAEEGHDQEQDPGCGAGVAHLEEPEPFLVDEVDHCDRRFGWAGLYEHEDLVEDLEAPDEAEDAREED